MDRTEHNLTDGITHLSTEITKADAKAGQILTLDGFLVAALSLIGKSSAGAALIVEAVGALALTASALLALLVIRPRLTVPGSADRASFIYWATATPDEIEEGMREDRRKARIHTLSRIALRKMRVQRLAGDMAFIAAAAIAVAALLSH
ncbi:Pycsar system effector family protein [Streptomyces sp. NPDC050355]|uniref:Pycsar system effector family protein n=1 Tax=Streptomyces sp. NPDC050355 TaxID=3365609 RepID=UPI0037A83BCB